MAIASNHRWIAVGKLALRNRKNAPHYAPEFLVKDLVNALEDRITRDDFRRNYGRDSRLMWCDKLTEDNQYYRLILQVGDRNVTGMSFLNFKEFTTHDFEKEKEEGSHYASHILIRKAADGNGRYLILVEKVPGIYLSSIKDYFTWACNHVSYEKKANDDEGQVKTFRPHFEVLGHQSKTIREALRTGVLRDVELIRHHENYQDGLDEDPIIKEVAHETRFEVKRRVSEDQARSVFKTVLDLVTNTKYGSTDKTQMFVRIKAGNGQVKRTEVNYHGEDILEQAFIQNEFVTDFDQPLTQRYNDFRDDMIQKMLAVADNVGD